MNANPKLSPAPTGQPIDGSVSTHQSCRLQVADQAVLTNVWVAIHRNFPSAHSGFRLPLLWMTLPQHTTRQGDGSSSVDASPLGDISPWGMPSHPSCAYYREALWTMEERRSKTLTPLSALCVRYTSLTPTAATLSCNPIAASLVECSWRAFVR